MCASCRSAKSTKVFFCDDALMTDPASATEEENKIAEVREPL